MLMMRLLFHAIQNGIWSKCRLDFSSIGLQRGSLRTVLVVLTSYGAAHPDFFQVSRIHRFYHVRSSISYVIYGVLQFELS